MEGLSRKASMKLPTKLKPGRSWLYLVCLGAFSLSAACFVIVVAHVISLGWTTVGVEIVGVDWFGQGLLSNKMSTGVFTNGSIVEYRGPGAEQRPVSDPHPYRFIQFSGYRTGPHSFVGIAAGALKARLKRRLGLCTWRPFAGVAVRGNLTDVYPGEHHSLTYETLLLYCTFAPSSATKQPGHLFLTVDNNEVLLFKEESHPHASLMAQAPFKHEVVMCSPPIYGHIDARRVYEFLEYYAYMGVNYFVMYDLGGVDKNLTQLFDKYKAKGMLEIVPAANSLDWWCNGHVAFMHDCVYRNLYTAQWVFHVDFDEYFYSYINEESLTSLLRRYEDRPVVSFGSLWYSTYLCHPTETLDAGAWPVERMAFHWPYPFCNGIKIFERRELCLNYWGHRKSAVNPRKVKSLNIHMALSWENEEPNADIDTTEATVFHWRGLTANSADFCNTTVQPNENILWWAQAQEMKSLVRKVRTYPLITRTAADLDA